MTGLKELKTRISSVQSTKRITSAMKMVAAAKLKKAQSLAIGSRPYTRSMESMLMRLTENSSGEIALLNGTGKDNNILIIVVGSDRGLCAGFNANMCRDVKKTTKTMQENGKNVSIMPIGRKVVALLKREFKDIFVNIKEDFIKSEPQYSDAEIIANIILKQFDDGAFDRCIIYYNKFVSALVQEATPLQLIPVISNENSSAVRNNKDKSTTQYEFEPNQEEILQSLIPANIRVQIFHAMIESYASEQGARMSAMDNATRNAGDMIDRLKITYNRSRQAIITKELIEIISGAEAL